MYFKLLWLSIVLSFICCKSEVKENTISISEESPWPITQDEVSDLSKAYDQCIPLKKSMIPGRFAVEKDGYWSIVDEKNQLYFPFEYDTIIYNSSLFALKKGLEYEVYDTSRNFIMAIKGKELRPVMSNFFASVKNEKLALFNPNGFMIRDYEFDNLSGPIDESYFLGFKNGSWAAYDLIGEELDSNARATSAVKFLTEYKVGLKSYGPLQIGMNKTQIESVLGFNLTELYKGETCSIYSLGNDFLDVQLMINSTVGKALLERIYIKTHGIATKSGIGIGSLKEDVLDAYGVKIEEMPNKYDTLAQDLFYVPSDRKDRNYRLNFLYKNGKIDAYSIGRLPSIEYVEGCF
ncbi:hypothetical protein [Portibacter lacus]|uniref:WG repeat-containing protein n=1 Tax=Portibacter lacus TaxID=1099794 RepID=A0AA37SQP5_9BACT|nr:hypothetical protein [Portibacter lacus]GLR18082.1 hypothetical protein GCM10007940_26970 [Portibacter lacus]